MSLSDKPLAICREDFDLLLREAYAEAHKPRRMDLRSDDERYDALNILTRELMHDPDLFGSCSWKDADNRRLRDATSTTPIQVGVGASR